MSIYGASSEEILRTRELLAEWTGDGFLSKAQYQLLERENASELRTTNIFLRIALFLFTLVIVAAATALFSVVVRPSEQAAGVFLLVFAAICYAAAEAAVSQAKLYRCGIEEALLVGSVGFLCLGMQLAFFSYSHDSPKPHSAQFLVPAAGIVLSLWIWRRFGLIYAFAAAMIFVLFLAGDWTSSREAQRGIIVVIYAIGLAGVITAHRRHRFDHLGKAYSLVEALLWLGIYLAINLQLSALTQRWPWWDSAVAAHEFPRPFYWATWVLIWCLPPIVLARGVRQRDRSAIAVGAVAAVLTLVSNKPYLGWPKHTWDPMILGMVLTSVAIFIRRWLAGGPDGSRYGFTAARLSGKDKDWLNVAATVAAPLAPHTVTPESADFHFGGGQSGGGGASGDF